MAEVCVRVGSMRRQTISLSIDSGKLKRNNTVRENNNNCVRLIFNQPGFFLGPVELFYESESLPVV